MAENEPNKETKNTASEQTATEPKNQSADKSAAQKSGASNGDSVKETLNKAKDAAGQAATQVAGRAQEKASALLVDQKSNLAAGINAIAGSVRNIGDNMQQDNDAGKNQIAAFAGRYGDTIADRIEQFSQYVEDRDFREIARDTERFARRNPALFVGGAFAVGLLAARIFKSSGTKRINVSRSLKFLDGKESNENAAQKS